MRLAGSASRSSCVSSMPWSLPEPPQQRERPGVGRMPPRPGKLTLLASRWGAYLFFPSFSRGRMRMSCPFILNPPLPVHRCQGGPRVPATDRHRDAVPGRVQGLPGVSLHACGWKAVTSGRFFSLGSARNSSRLRKFAAPARLAPNFTFLTVRPFPYRGGCPGSARPLLVPSPRRGASHAESYISSFDAERRVSLL
jgi:hypothetical protein